jgi:hypothetical protein
VIAVALLFDLNDEFITTADVLIDYNPVLPGQVSPFEVMATYNPAVRKAGVELEELFGVLS